MTCIPSKSWLRAEASDQGWNELLVPWLGLDVNKAEAVAVDSAKEGGPGRWHRDYRSLGGSSLNPAAEHQIDPDKGPPW